MPSKLTIIAFIALMLVNHCPAQQLTILFDPDSPQKGIAVLQHEPQPRLMLAERLSITKNVDLVTVTIERLKMLTQDDSGTRVIAANRYPCQFSSDDEIVINDLRLSALDAARVYPVIPSTTATLSNIHRWAPDSKATEQSVIYPIQKGDTISKVCELFRITRDQLMQANPDLLTGEDLTGLNWLAIPNVDDRKQAELSASPRTRSSKRQTEP